MISGFRHAVAENCTLLGYYAASSDNFLSTETFNRPHSSLHKLRFGATGFLLNSWTLRMGLICCPEMSAINYRYWLHNDPEERSSKEVNFLCLMVIMMMMMMMIVWVVQSLWWLGYEIDGRGFGVKFWVGARDFFFPLCANLSWIPPCILSNGYRRLFRAFGKLARWMKRNEYWG
jgi:hypothetical protein